jgi:hypothetical protein
MPYLTGANLLGDTIFTNILYYCIAGWLILGKNNNMKEGVREREEDGVRKM